MGVMWVTGMLSTMGGCQEIEYLRGDSQLADKLDRTAEEATEPLLRAELVRQRARLEALGHEHATAFPLAAARMVIGMLLVVAAGAAIVGRPGARRLAMQAVLASCGLAVLAFFLLARVRHASADAVAEDVVDEVLGVPQGMTRADAVASERSMALQRERAVLVLEVAMFGAAFIALTRRRTKAYFEALEGSLADAEP
jgi:hypothetical protein